MPEGSPPCFRTARCRVAREAEEQGERAPKPPEVSDGREVFGTATVASASFRAAAPTKSLRQAGQHRGEGELGRPLRLGPDLVPHPTEIVVDEEAGTEHQGEAHDREPDAHDEEEQEDESDPEPDQAPPDAGEGVACDGRFGDAISRLAEPTTLPGGRVVECYLYPTKA